MNKYTSLEQMVREMARGNAPESARDYRSIEAAVRGVLRPQNNKPVTKRVTDEEELSPEELEHSRVADLQKKNKIIDNP